MAEDRLKYIDYVTECKNNWDKSSPKEKELYQAVIGTMVSGFLLWWDTLKAIEKKFNIDVMGIAREERWKFSLAAGQRLAKKYENHGLKDLYDAFNSQFEGIVNAEWLECNDNVFHKWNFACPCIDHFRDLGRSDEEIKEMAPYFCLLSYGTMQGFNPELEVFPQSRILMKGDSHCSYRVEDNREDENKIST